jgi:hypothetical protein
VRAAIRIIVVVIYAFISPFMWGTRRRETFSSTDNRKSLTQRHFEKMIDKWARLLNVQKLQSIKPSGREYHLIMLVRLREAGERHHDRQWR